MQQYDFGALWPLSNPPALDLTSDMKALVAARLVLQNEADPPTASLPESVILASADSAVRAAHLDLIDLALCIRVGIALADGYDRDALCGLGMDDSLLLALGIWDYVQSQLGPAPGGEFRLRPEAP
jgi:hypothetical protein